MRTNTLIDDQLMKETLRLTGAKTKREAVELGLRTLVRLHQQAEIRQFQASSTAGDLDAMRTIGICRSRRSTISSIPPRRTISRPPGRSPPPNLILCKCCRLRQIHFTGQELMSSLGCWTGRNWLAIHAAENFRKLRALGITVRKTIDTLIATRCIEAVSASFRDRDFEPFVKHLGLRSAM